MHKHLNWMRKLAAARQSHYLLPTAGGHWAGCLGSVGIGLGSGGAALRGFALGGFGRFALWGGFGRFLGLIGIVGDIPPAAFQVKCALGYEFGKFALAKFTIRERLI